MIDHFTNPENIKAALAMVFIAQLPLGIGAILILSFKDHTKIKCKKTL